MLAEVGSMIRVCMFSCCYENVSVANYTFSLLSHLRNRKEFNIRWISSHCRCIERFPNRKSACFERCLFIGLPYLARPRSRMKIVSIAFSAIQKSLDILRGFTFLQKIGDCDLVHFQQSSSYSFSIVPLLPIILLSPKKKIVTLHSIDEIQRAFKFFFRFYNRVDKVIVHSESMRVHLIENGVAESRITIIRHGANIPRLLGLKRMEMTFFGAPVEIKGISTIFDALKILKERNLDVRLSIYGLYSDSERKIAESQADSRGVKNNLVWGGSLTEFDFDKKLQQSLFTLAVYNTPVSGSSVITRAMSNATPVIASDVGGLKEYLNGGGIVIAPKNPESLANAIELLLRNADIRDKLGRVGREFAIKSLSWKKIAEQTAAIYSSTFDKVPNQRA